MDSSSRHKVFSTRNCWRDGQPHDRSVILAAGPDARAYRLALARRNLGLRTDPPTAGDRGEGCPAGRRRTHRPAGADRCRPDHRLVRRAARTPGSDPHAPSVWKRRPAVPDETAVRTLFDRVSTLSTSGPVAPTTSSVLPKSPVMAPLRQPMVARAPYCSGTDEPGELLQRNGWAATVTDVGEPAPHGPLVGSYSTAECSRTTARLSAAATAP